ncbi:MAG: HD domain-containing protein [Planctomycetota bacterium]|nr:MAG: HD domain-containing protein [Planctomycetota bacterium]REJ91978.1 MAG: HD domain-containing protein [Planctomycetota bacterium]REK27235.1 MAG: HD domain-containing protein [Planctomycetota bacterium]REK36743.1 MAG: HD domain-containing protein [Planctomycetota bacterium]
MFRMQGPMTQRTKTVLALALTQAACLAAGLWIQHQFLAAVATSTPLVGEESEAGAAGPAGKTTAPGDSRLAIHLLAFLWIMGLQGGAAWLVLSRMQVEQERLTNASQEQSLLRAREVVRTRDAVIFGLAKLAESRDPDTGHHLERIALYSTRLAMAMRRHPKFRSVITQSFIHSIGISSALHDIGKVGVEDSILLKPGRLTPDEREKIQEHTRYGGDCIRLIQKRVDDPTFLEMALEIAMHHHEKWDGTGYPHGLHGENIPLAARVVAIADVYDALSVRRVYKPAYPHEECVDRIRRDAGSHFDPDIVEVFLSIHTKFRDIARRLGAGAEVEENALDGAANGIERSYAEMKMTEEQQQLLEATVRESSAAKSERQLSAVRPAAAADAARFRPASQQAGNTSDA